MEKKTIVVLFGGKSSEYEVSLASAYAVLTHFNSHRYHVLPIGITREGEWFLFTGAYEDIKKNQWMNKECQEVMISPNATTKEIIIFNKHRVERKKIDAVLPILHGKNGEDGTVQGIIQMAKIPLIGCDVCSSAICMDKDKAHKLVSMAGIKTPQSLVLDTMYLVEEKVKEMQALTYPLFIKPMKAGSSLGISKISCEAELIPAIKKAFKYDSEVIVEEHIEGFEVGCAIMGVRDLVVGSVDEIELTEGFFDFIEKYTLKSSHIHMPARMDIKIQEEIQKVAKKIYKVLGCSVFARIDMFLTPTNEIVFNEVNTIPGFTEHSRYPNMMKGVGMHFTELLDAIIEIGLQNENNYII